MHTGISGKNLREGAGALLVLLAVLILLAGLVRGLNYLVVDDADSYTRLAMHELYTGEEPVETLFLGSSHCFRAYDPALYEALTGYGYRCIKPDGAFYLFVEALEPDAAAFAEKAKEFELLLVASDSFGTSGFVRISYCVSTAQIEAALPAFQKLAEAYHE